MLKTLTKPKINHILIACQTPDAVKVLSYIEDGRYYAGTTAQTLYNVLSSIDFFKNLGSKEKSQYEIQPDGCVMIVHTSTSPDGSEQSIRQFIVQFYDNSFLK